MTDFAIRLTPPYAEDVFNERWEEFTKRQTVTEWLVGREVGGDTGKLHFHGYVKFTNKESSLRKHVRDVFVCLGNGAVSIKPVDDLPGWLSYCMKDGQYRTSEGLNLQKVPKWVAKKERTGARGKLDKMLAYAKSRGARGMLPTFHAVYSYHEANGYLLPSAQLMQSYVWSLRMMRGGKDAEKSREEYFMSIWRGQYAYDPEENPQGDQEPEAQSAEDPDAF